MCSAPRVPLHLPSVQPRHPHRHRVFSHALTSLCPTCTPAPHCHLTTLPALFQPLPHDTLWPDEFGCIRSATHPLVCIGYSPPCLQYPLVCHTVSTFSDPRSAPSLHLNPALPPASPQLPLRCWTSITSSLPNTNLVQPYPAPSPPAPPHGPAMHSSYSAIFASSGRECNSYTTTPHFALPTASPSLLSSRK